VDNFDKRQAVVAELLRDAGRSDRLIAEKLGGVVSSGLVRKVRLKLEQEGKVQPAGKRIGKDDRRRGQRRNLKPMRERLLTLLKGRETDIDELRGRVHRMTAKQLEESLADLEGEKVFAPGQPEASPPTDEPAQPTDDEFIKWGLVGALILEDDYTEEEAMKAAEKLLGHVKEENDRQQWIDRGKEYLEHRRASEQGNAGQRT
jgi:hypothetical protein